MRSPKKLFLIGLLCLPFPGGAAGADGIEVDRSCGEDVARKVQGHYESIQDLRARFEQTQEGTAFGGVAAPGAQPVRGGTVVLRKPGRMRWSYETPDPSLLVTNGQVVWMYDPLLEEAQRLPDAGGLLSGAAVQFLMGQGDLLASFSVQAVDCDATPVRLEMLPREDAGYERLALDVDPASGRVTASTVTDLFGNRTRVVLRDVRTNTAPEASLFEFSPPEGVEVFDLTPPADAAGQP
ncbi:MAG: outer membrane lipoprotein carrier protein LolA [Myxococcales bacterium]|nr:outer membrane lipoprotein carrier protein LolA [Myxococcales bacterium]